MLNLKTSHMKTKQKRIFTVISLIFIVFLILILLFKCNSSDGIKVIPANETIFKKTENTFITNFFSEADIKYASYKVNTSQEYKFIHSTGTKIYIPANAFVDKNGEPVNGDVDLLYREMHTPWDIMVSGIPMTYESNSTTYHFESAGMFDIKATLDKMPVFIAPGKNIIVEMVSQNPSNRFNNYYLDTTIRRWIELGKTKILYSKQRVKPDSIRFNAKLEIPMVPIKPQNADSVNNILIINIENRKDFPEFDPFERLKFEVMESHGQYRVSKEPLICALPEISPSQDHPGCYNLKMMIKTDQQEWINWLVRPAYEGLDYEKAMRIYQKQQIQYQEKLRVIEEQKKLAEQRAKQEETINQLYRVINISQFGIYNFDNPIFIEWKEFIPRFEDKHGEKLNLHFVMIIDSSINGVIRFNLDENPKIRMNTSTNQKIVGVANDTLIYACSSGDFTFTNEELKMERFKKIEDLKKYIGKN